MNRIRTTVAITLLACAGVANAKTINTSTATTEQLLARRAVIENKMRDDNFGVFWGPTRWISHAAEKNSVLKEQQAITAELARRDGANAPTPSQAKDTMLLNAFKEIARHDYGNKSDRSLAATCYKQMSPATQHIARLFLLDRLIVGAQQGKVTRAQVSAIFQKAVARGDMTRAEMDAALRQVPQR